MDNNQRQELINNAYKIIDTTPDLKPFVDDLKETVDSLIDLTKQNKPNPLKRQSAMLRQTCSKVKWGEIPNRG